MGNFIFGFISCFILIASFVGDIRQKQNECFKKNNITACPLYTKAGKQ